MSLLPIFVPGGAPDITLEGNRSKSTWTSAAEPYTFSSVDLGSSSVSHKVVLAIGGSNNFGGDDLSSGTVTVGGNSATHVISQVATDNPHATIWYVDGITATSGDVVINFAGGNDFTNGLCSVHALYDAASGGAFATSSSTADPSVLDLNVEAGGVIIATTVNTNTTGANVTWTDIDELYDERPGSNNCFSGAARAYAAAVTPQNVDANFSEGTLFAGVATAWSKA